MPGDTASNDSLQGIFEMWRRRGVLILQVASLARLRHNDFAT
jgi:hypothetical protein